MNPFVVGLGGYGRSGKDTAGDGLVDWGWKRDAMADVLRDILAEIDPMIPTAEGMEYRLWELLCLGWETAKAFPEVRRLLIDLGVALRAVDPDFLINAVWNRTVVGYEGPVVITDVRYPNEVQRIREHGGVYIRIRRPGYGPVVDHFSETALDDVEPDVWIENDSTPKDLCDRVLSAVLREYRELQEATP